MQPNAEGDSLRGGEENGSNVGGKRRSGKWPQTHEDDSLDDMPGVRGIGDGIPYELLDGSCETDKQARFFRISTRGQQNDGPE